MARYEKDKASPAEKKGSKPLSAKDKAFKARQARMDKAKTNSPAKTSPQKVPSLSHHPHPCPRV